MIEDYFKSYKIFTDTEIQNFIKHFEVKQVKKNDFFVKQGATCNKVAYVNNGVFRSFTSSQNGENTSCCFRFPHKLMTAYSAFISNNTSQESIQAICDAEILVIDKNKLEELGKENYKWLLFSKTIAEEEYLELEQRIFQLQSKSALQKYNQLLLDQPEYIQQIPLHYLASYLGITQRHLSRIRKEVTF
ncbi:CRP-like cAMP-binding protein [Wenyingzhuangia heitensis]|uniref:CRP-like cAMP-binding protein n=1 Tax=Wenyingzhuangia heitensis TaxID=1487859 RepID=A0ABX0U6M0_9FLAO|nr:Crp/Fnr family transcriptional regulator [Wenyingzhuangia heitensis]NIJ44408.1 CRP-like cAMP-binding protein [Wenyingzhuangia heitensis]